MSANISRARSSHTPLTSIEKDDAEIMNLFESINTYRYDANAIGSSRNTLSHASVSNQTTSNSLLAKLIDYFNHNMLVNKTIKKIQKKLSNSGKGMSDDGQ